MACSCGLCILLHDKDPSKSNQLSGFSARTGICISSRCQPCKTIRKAFDERYGTLEQWSGRVGIEWYRGGVQVKARSHDDWETLASLYLFPKPALKPSLKLSLKRRVQRLIRPLCPTAEGPREDTEENTGEGRSHALPRLKPRSVHPKTVDLNLARNWISKCRNDHGERCSHKDKSWTPPGSFRLIDVQQQCLVHGSTQNEYVALSYVWGKTQKIMATRATLPLLERSGGLRELKEKLPATISDAITFTSAIGARYIWIDALCIIQDDEKSKHAQIGQMHQIYRHADLTITAAAGSDADSGLPGVTGYRPRIIKQESFRHGEWVYFISQRPLESVLGESQVNTPNATSKWNGRAWTYQERLFSARKVVFLEEGMHWNCNCVTWMEDIEEDSINSAPYFQMFDFDPIRKDPKGLFSTKDSYSPSRFSKPNIDDYCTIVREYSVRKLSYEDDVLNALSGTLMALNFKGGFLFGIPKALAAECLLWQPVTTVSRRSPTHANHIESKFPSWCWSGWIGPISTETWHSAQTNPPGLTAFEEYLAEVVPQTFRTAQFEKPGASDGDDCATAGSPAPGMGRPAGDDTFGQASTPASPEAPRLEQDSPFLIVRTERARFRLARYTLPENPDVCAVAVFDPRRNVQCGFVQLHNHSYIPENGNEDTLYDLISISRGEIGIGKFDRHFGAFHEGDDVFFWAEKNAYRYQNVLLLSWVGEVGYRVGLGRVSERGWNASSPSKAVLRLG